PRLMDMDSVRPVGGKDALQIIQVVWILFGEKFRLPAVRLDPNVSKFADEFTGIGENELVETVGPQSGQVHTDGVGHDAAAAVADETDGMNLTNAEGD